jgi:hypothetical protein
LRERLRALNNQLILHANQCQVKPPAAPEPAPAPENPPLRNAERQPRTETPLMENLLPQTQAPSSPEIIEIKPEIQNTTPERPSTVPPETPERPLTVPPEAPERNDLSFLQGCWTNSSSLYNQADRAPLLMQYCFDANGQGSRTVQQPDGSRCQGPARASFDNSGKLLLEADAAGCTAGGQYVPQRIECRGSGNSTNCQGREQGQDRQWQAGFQRQ